MCCCYQQHQQKTKRYSNKQSWNDSSINKSSDNENNSNIYCKFHKKTMIQQWRRQHYQNKVKLKNHNLSLRFEFASIKQQQEKSTLVAYPHIQLWSITSNTTTGPELLQQYKEQQQQHQHEQSTMDGSTPRLYRGKGTNNTTAVPELLQQQQHPRQQQMFGKHRKQQELVQLSQSQQQIDKLPTPPPPLRVIYSDQINLNQNSMMASLVSVTTKETNTKSNTTRNNFTLEAFNINQQHRQMQQKQQRHQQRPLLPPQFFLNVTLLLSFLIVQIVGCQQFMSITSVAAVAVATSTTISQFKPNSNLNNNADIEQYNNNNNIDMTYIDNRKMQQKQVINSAFISRKQHAIGNNIIHLPCETSNFIEKFQVIEGVVRNNASNNDYKTFFKRNHISQNSIYGIITNSRKINKNNSSYSSSSNTKNDIEYHSKYLLSKQNTRTEAEEVNIENVQINNATASLKVKQNFYKTILSSNKTKKAIIKINYMFAENVQNNSSNIINKNYLSPVAKNAVFQIEDDVFGGDDDNLDPEVDDVSLSLTPNRFTDYEDNQKLIKLVMDGLGLQRLPDMKKANISQSEYALKYREYLRRMNERKLRELSMLEHPLDQIKWEDVIVPIRMLTIARNTSELVVMRGDHRSRQRRDVQQKASSKRHNDKITHVILRFPLDAHATQLRPGDIEEANIRLMLITSSALAAKHLGSAKKGKRQNLKQQFPAEKAATPKKHLINLKVFQLLDEGRRLWLDGKKIEIEIDRNKADDTYSHWVEFDVRKAVESWLTDRQTNLGLEIQCDNCYRNGARIIDDLSEVGSTKKSTYPADEESNDDDNKSDDDVDSPAVTAEAESLEEKFDLTPVLNIIGRLGVKHQEHRSKQQSVAAAAQSHHHTAAGGSKAKAQPRKTNCYKENQRCCRHNMEVIFKEIKGFEFIIQPKVFDAGYCRGRCPPRYNPAHHHALLQSLIWKQDRKHVPRPCCAPSKLVELEVLHVDEKDSDKLKISTWTDMRVLECACS